MSGPRPTNKTIALNAPDTSGKPKLSARTSVAPTALNKNKAARRNFKRRTTPKTKVTEPKTTPRPVVSAAGLPRPMNLGASTPQEAIKTYTTLAYGTSSKASYAAYSLAYVNWKLGRRGAALKATNFYKRRFAVSKPHYKHVLWLRINVLCKHHVTASCRTAAHDYLAKFRNGRFHKTAEMLVRSADQ